MLVAGGAGAVGHAAIQLAVWAGATVITTVSSHEKAELARRPAPTTWSTTATRTPPRRSGRWRRAAWTSSSRSNISANAELDTARRRAERDHLDLRRRSGRSGVDCRSAPACRRTCAASSCSTYTTDAATKDAAVRAVAAAVADGALPVGAEHGLPITRFPLERTADAHDAVEGGAVGKVLIDVE